MGLVPNIDKPTHLYDKPMRESVARGDPPDIEVDDAPRRTVRGKVRVATAVEWRQIGYGLLATVWANGMGRTARHETITREQERIAALAVIDALLAGDLELRARTRAREGCCSWNWFKRGSRTPLKAG